MPSRVGVHKGKARGTVGPGIPLGGADPSSAVRAIRLHGRKFDFEVPLGNGRIIPTGGGAVLGEGTRPQRAPITLYEGEAPITLDVPVLLDGWPNRSVKDGLDQILGLCFGDDGERPPDFTASGPMPFSGRRFVMDGLPEFGEALGSPNGQRHTVRQALTLHLREFEDPDVLNSRRVKGRRKGGQVGPGTALGAVDLPRQMSLVEVAAHYLHDPGRAKEIGDLNGVRDVTKKLDKGRRIKLPSSADA